MADLEIREQIARYIADEIDAPTLEDWLEDVADPAQALAADALRLLAEHGNGDWTDAQLREQLWALRGTYWFDQAPKQTFTGSEGQIIRQSLNENDGEVMRLRAIERCVRDLLKSQVALSTAITTLPAWTRLRKLVGP